MDRDTRSLAPDPERDFFGERRGLEDFDERNLKIYAEKHISNICENWNREMRKEDSHAGTTYICAQSCGIYIAWR